MQIDGLSSIISSMTVPQFRTLCLECIKLLGYSEVNLTDGPYDGVKDYKLLHSSSEMKSISIAMSITPNWQKKLKDDIQNMKRKNKDLSNVFYFSSHRMPEGSFSKYQKEMAEQENIFVIKYDNQTIASEFIKKNKVNKILEIADIDIGMLSENNQSNRKLLNKNIAMSSLLLFSDDANELRKSFFETIIETQIAKSPKALSREELIDLIINEYVFNSEQAAYINSQFDRLLQSKKIYVKEGLYYLLESENLKIKGIESQFNVEFNNIKNDVIKLLEKSDLYLTETEMDDLLDNIEDFILGLVRASLGLSESKVDEKGAYQYIRKLLEEKYNKQDGSKVIENLLEKVARSPFAKRIASTEIIIDLFNVNSDDLLNIFKAETSLSVYLDTSVVIPLLCSLLYGEFYSRYSYSANTLYELLQKHKFKMFIMDKYLEEVASHLIKAAQIYKIVDVIDEPLFSQNAFITHYSLLRKKEHIEFADYLETFDIKLVDIPDEEESMHKFKSVRQALEQSMQEIFQTYNINVIRSNNIGQYSLEIDNLAEIRSRKADILLEHDAATIKHLSTTVNSNNSNVLCTWDRSLIEYKAKYYHIPFHILSPIALIDLMSMAKGEKTNFALASYINFAKLQDEKILEMSSDVWEILIKIEKNELLDAHLIRKAKEFQKSYIEKYQDLDKLDQTTVSKDWLAWKDKE